MDEIAGMARHPEQRQLLQRMMMALVGIAVFGLVGFVWPRPPEPEAVPSPFDPSSYKRSMDMDQWRALVSQVDPTEPREPEELFALEEFQRDLQRHQVALERVREHDRCISLSRLSFTLCAGGLLWLGSLFVQRRPVPVLVRLHQLQIGTVVLPWSEIREVALGARGCRVSTRDGQILLQGYVIEDKGELQRAAALALDHSRSREGPIPPEMAALRGRLPDGVRQ